MPEGTNPTRFTRGEEWAIKASAQEGAPIIDPTGRITGSSILPDEPHTEAQIIAAVGRKGLLRGTQTPEPLPAAEPTISTDQPLL